MNHQYVSVSLFSSNRCKPLKRFTFAYPEVYDKVFFSKDISCTTLRLHFHCIYYYKVACRRSELSSNWSITGIKRTQFSAESTLTDGRVSSRYFNPKRHSCYIEKGRSNWIFLSTCLSGRRLWVFVPRLGWVQSQLILPALPCGSGSGVSLLCSQP